MKNHIRAMFTLVAIGYSVGALAQAGQSPQVAQWHYNPASIMNAIRHPHSDLTIIAAHRGLHQVWGYDTNTGVPENSLQAIYNTAAEGIEAIELDIRLTQDGTPVISHDSTWGRETNVGANWNHELFDAFGAQPGLSTPDGDPGEMGGGTTGAGSQEKAGVNPNVSDWSIFSVEQLLLRTNAAAPGHCCNWAWANGQIPDLALALAYIKDNQLPLVVAIDIKDASALGAAWGVVKQNIDYDGAPFHNYVFFKFDGRWVYPYPSNWKDAFNQPGIDGFPDYTYMNVMPVYQTSHIMKGGPFGSDSGIIDAAEQWVAQPQTVGIEVNYKQPNGILTQVVNTSGLKSKAFGEFMPYAEYMAPGDSRYRYYYSNGYCCATLSEYHFNGGPTGQGSDTEDDREQWPFIENSSYGFNFITTDNAVPFAEDLAKKGKRNTSYFQ